MSDNKLDRGFMINSIYWRRLLKWLGLNLETTTEIPTQELLYCFAEARLLGITIDHKKGEYDLEVEEFLQHAKANGLSRIFITG